MEHDLSGMSPFAAKEFIFGFIATLKLTEKEILYVEEEAAKWKTRANLARSRGADDLLSEAEREADRANSKLTALREEESVLKSKISAMRSQLPRLWPSLAARERSVDADLLEQELLMALGQTEEEAKTDRAFKKMEKERDADAALEALKAKLKN